MLKGQNTDIDYQGRWIHVQTEDWGIQNPYIVTRIFSAGQVIYTIKTDYSAWIKKNIQNLDLRLQKALSVQHDDTIQSVRQGKWL